MVVILSTIASLVIILCFPLLIQWWQSQIKTSKTFGLNYLLLWGDGGWHAKSSELGEPFRAIFSLICASSWPNRRIYDDFRRFARNLGLIMLLL